MNSSSSSVKQGTKEGYSIDMLLHSSHIHYTAYTPTLNSKLQNLSYIPLFLDTVASELEFGGEFLELAAMNGINKIVRKSSWGIDYAMFCYHTFSRVGQRRPATSQKSGPLAPGLIMSILKRKLKINTLYFNKFIITLNKLLV